MKKLLVVWIASVAGLLLIGLLAIYSATARQVHPERFYSHTAWIAAGLAGGLVAASFHYSILQKWNLPRIFLGILILLLGLVLVPGIGEEINGSRRWFRFGGQPSEPAKLALILALADYGSRRLPSMNQFKLGFLAPAGMAGIVVGLIFLEPDWGTAILTGAVAMAVMISAGTCWRHVGSVVLSAVIGLAILIQSHPERLRRLPILVEQMPGNHHEVWQVWQSLLSFSAGGWWGTSPGLGGHKYGFVAEQETDFILSLVGEELGFLGTSAVVILFVSLLGAGIGIVWRIKDPFGQLLVIGITFMIGLQAFINIGVVTSILPCKGLPLPFISYGGSNLVCLLTAAGCVISVARFAPSAALAHLPILAQVNPQAPARAVSNPAILERSPNLVERGLFRICYGPHWTYWTSLQHHYQLPPQGGMIRPRSGFHRWLMKRCARRLPERVRTTLSFSESNPAVRSITTRPDRPLAERQRL